MEEQYYLYNGKLFSQSTLADKYGDQVDAKIDEYGFEKAYSFGDKVFSSSQLQEKYGDDYEAVASEKGISPYSLKKKDSTESSSTQNSTATTETDGSGEKKSSPNKVATALRSIPNVAGARLAGDFVDMLDEPWERGRVTRKLADWKEVLLGGKVADIQGEKGSSSAIIKDGISIEDQLKGLDEELGEFKSLKDRKLNNEEIVEVVDRIDAAQKELEAIPIPEARQRLNELLEDDNASLAEIGWHAATHPAAVVDLRTESMAMAPEALLISAVGGIGGYAGLMASQAAAAYISEDAVGINEALAANGIDPQNKEDLIRLATDVDLQSRIKRSKNIRTGTMAGIEAIIAGISFGMAKGGVASKIGGGLLEFISGGVSEAGSMYAQTGKVDVKEAFVEILADAHSNTVSTARVVYEGMKGKKTLSDTDESVNGRPSLDKIDKHLSEGNKDAIQELIDDKRLIVEDLPEKQRKETLKLLGNDRNDNTASETGESKKLDDKAKPQTEKANGQDGSGSDISNGGVDERNTTDNKRATDAEGSVEESDTDSETEARAADIVDKVRKPDPEPSGKPDRVEERRAKIFKTVETQKAEIVDRKSKTTSQTEAKTKELKGLGKLLDATKSFKKDGVELQVVVAPDGDSFTEIARTAIGNEKVDQGLDENGQLKSSGFYDADSHTIFVDRSIAGDTDLTHEFFHPILDAKLKQDPKWAADLADSALKNDETGELQSFIDEYKTADQNKEAVVQGLADYLHASVQKPTISDQVKKIINDILTAIGIDRSVAIKGDEDYKALAEKLYQGVVLGKGIKNDAAGSSGVSFKKLRDNSATELQKLSKSIELNTKGEIERVAKSKGEDGATFNLDGTTYDKGGLAMPAASLNLPASDITGKVISDFVSEHKSKLGSDAVKVGIYKFPNGKDASVDLNIVAPKNARDIAIQFAREAGQKSLYDLETGKYIETGADGKNPKTLSDAEFVKIAQAISEKSKPKAGNKLFSEPLPEVSDIADKYIKSKFGRKREPFKGTRKLNKERAKEIAKAYEEMKDNYSNPQVKKAYDALVSETMDQWKSMEEAGYTIEVNNQEPYANSTEMIEDLRDNKRMKIFSTESGFGSDGITEEMRANNPLLAKTDVKDTNGQALLVNDVFRAVHDFFGHAELGNSFGQLGEENAWNVHARMFSPEAAWALTSETRGQNSWVNFSGVNDFLDPLREKARKLRAQGKDQEAAAITDEIYEKMKFADQKVGLLPREFAIPDGVDSEITSESIAKTALQREVPLEKQKLSALAKIFDRLEKDKVPVTGAERNQITRFVKRATDELSLWLSNPVEKTGMSWYTKDMVAFDSEISKVIPEIDTPEKTALFKAIMAVTSGGQKVNGNLRTAYAVWKNSPDPLNGDFSHNWGDKKTSFYAKKKRGQKIAKTLATGVVVDETLYHYHVQPTDFWGNPNGKKVTKVLKSQVNQKNPTGYTARPTAVKDKLETISRILKEQGGIEGMVSWLKQSHDISDLREYNHRVPDTLGKNNKNPVGKREGFYVLGEKLGAFYSNLQGIPESITMDLWWSRTWNRYMGTMIDADGNVQETPRNDKERSVMRKSVATLSKITGLEPHELQAALWYMEQNIYTKMGVKSDSVSYLDAVKNLKNETGKTGDGVQSEVKRDLREDDKRRKDAAARAASAEVGEGVEQSSGVSWKKTNQRGVPKDIRKAYEDNLSFIAHEKAAEAHGGKTPDYNYSLDDSPWYTKMLTPVRELVQDDRVRVLKMQEALEKMGVNFSDKNDFYQSLTLQNKSVVAIKGLNWDIASRKNPDSLFNRIVEAGLDPEELGKYMAAVHAPERNKSIKDSNKKLFREVEGRLRKYEAQMKKMEEQESVSAPAYDALAKKIEKAKGQLARTADKVVNDYGGMTNAQAKDFMSTLSPEQQAQYKEFAAQYKERVITPILNMKLDAGIISQEQFDQLNKFDHYVPMKVEEFTLSKGMERKATGGNVNKRIQAIKGTDKYGFNQRVNPVFQGMNELAATINEVAKNESAQALYELASEYNIDQLRVWVPRNEFSNRVDQKTGKKNYTSHYNKLQEDRKERSLKLYVDGKVKYIEIKDPKLRKAIIQPDSFGKGVVQNKVLRAFATWFRYTNTIYNPEFLLSNITRDWQAALISSGLELPETNMAKIGAQITKKMPKAGKAIYQLEANGKIDGKYGQAYKEMKELGGIVEFFQAQSPQSELRAIQKQMHSNRSTAARKVSQGFGAMMTQVDAISDSAERATRLAVYMTAVEQGLSKKKAAALAKNVTVNFDRKGTAGSMINTLYIFANAGIQGSTRIITSMWKSGTVRKFAAALMFGGLIESTLFALAGGDPDDYELIPDYIKERNYILPNPWGEKKYIAIPMPYGYNVFKYMGNNTALLAERASKGYGGKTGGKAFSDTMISFMNAFNPLASSTIAQGVAPTIIDPVVQHITNTTWFGTPLSPPAYGGDERVESQAAYSSTPDMFIKAASAVNEATRFDKEKSLRGMIDWSPEVYENYLKSYVGGAPQVVMDGVLMAGNFIDRDQSMEEALSKVTLEKAPMTGKFFKEIPESAAKSYVYDIYHRRSVDVFHPDEVQKYQNRLMDLFSAGQITGGQFRSMFKDVLIDQIKLDMELQNVNAQSGDNTAN